MIILTTTQRYRISIPLTCKYMNLFPKGVVRYILTTQNTNVSTSDVTRLSTVMNSESFATYNGQWTEYIHTSKLKRLTVVLIELCCQFTKTRHKYLKIKLTNNSILIFNTTIDYLISDTKKISLFNHTFYQF